MGSPDSGPYQPGEEVTFRYTITQFEEVNCNWLHGIVPEFGNGWDQSSFNSNGEPHLLSCNLVAHTNGAWSWYPDGWVRYNLSNPAKGLSPGSAVGAGWFFLNFAQPSINPFDPNFTYGDSDDCNATGDTWEICFTLRANGVYECQNGADCSITMHPYSDSETGAQPVTACLNDVGTTHQAEVFCCGAPQMYPISDFYICSEEPINVPLFSTNPASTFSWTVSTTNVAGAYADAGPVINQTLSVIDPDLPGSVFYSVVPSVNGCEGLPEVFEVTLSDLRVNAGPDHYICSGHNVRLEGSTTGGLGPYAYEWDFGPTFPRPTVSPDQTTTYTLTATDFFGCTGVDEVTVYVNQTGPISGDTQPCMDNFGVYYSIPVFPGAHNYTWTVPDGATIISGQGSIQIFVDWSNSPGGEICVIPNGVCSNVIPSCIQVTTYSPPPLANIVGEQITCEGGQYTYELPGGDPNLIYNWVVINGTIISGQSSSEIVVEWNTNNSGGIVELSVGGFCGSSAATLEVQIFPPPTDTEIQGNDKICGGDVAIYFTIDPTNDAYTYAWYVPNGAMILSGQGTELITVDWGTAIGGDICLDITNNCTTVSECFTVSLFDPMTLAADGPLSVCEGTTAQYALTSSVPLNAQIQWTIPAGATFLSDPTKGFVNVRWDDDLGGDVCVEVVACGETAATCLAVMANGAVVSDTTVTLCAGNCFSFAGMDYCQTGQYTISLANPTGCDDVLNLDLTILDTPNIVADAGPDVQVGCTVDATLDGSGSSAGASITYEWRDENDLLIATTASATVNYAGVFTLTVSDATTLCVVSDDVTVSPAGPPTVTLGSAPRLNCFNNFSGTLDASGSSSGPNIVYLWTGPNGFSSNEQNPVVNTSGEYCLEVVDLQTGCPSSSACVQVTEGYGIDISATQSFCNDADGTAQVMVSGIPDPAFLWNNGATTSAIEDLAPGTYTVTVSNSISTCTDEASVVVSADLSCKVLIAGNVFDDSDDQQCVDDASVLPLDGIEVSLLPLGLLTTTDADGYYEFFVDTGAYVIEVSAPEPYFTKCPVDGLIPVTLLDTSDVSTANHFFFDYFSNYDLRVSALSAPAIAGSEQFYEITYCNDFFQSINGRLLFTHDPALTFDPVASGATSYDPATFTATWRFYDLSFFECENIVFYLGVPAGLPSGTIIESTVLGRPVLGDIQPNNNDYFWTTMVTGGAPPSIAGSADAFTNTTSIYLFPNEPNPFQEETQFSFYLPQSTQASLTVYDLNGRLLQQWNGFYEKGKHQQRIDGDLLKGDGLYFYRLETEGESKVGRMMKYSR